MKKQKSSKWIVGIFVLVFGIMFVSNVFKEKPFLLDVLNNAGVSSLGTVENELIVAFQDGQICTWDWTESMIKQGDFSVNTNRLAFVDENQLVAISKKGQKMLSLHQIPSGEKVKEIMVGWQDQDVWPITSIGNAVLALVRKNSPATDGSITYEYFIVNLEDGNQDIPTTLKINQKEDTLVDFCVSPASIVYATGGKNKLGRVHAIDLQSRQVLWDRVYDQTQEFCSVIVSPDREYLLAGNRDGFLYKLSAQTGDVSEKIQLLEEGEKRVVTNDFSVLNPAFSSDGQYFAVTIHPKVYILKSQTSKIIHTYMPADRLVSKVAFSPDNRFVATSDIRAGYPIKIWPLPQEKE